MATLRGALTILARRARPFLCQSQRYISTTRPVVGSHWNKDWQPGPIPHTPEERAAAAKKYGLRPEDYNCLADDEIGDYPHLPIVAKHWRDPFEDYDMPVDRRNYGEPVHPDDNIIGNDHWDKNADGLYTYGQHMLYAVLIFCGLAGTFLLFNPYPFFLPQMPKQFPFNDLYLEKGGDPALEPELKHYTFESEEESE